MSEPTTVPAPVACVVCGRLRRDSLRHPTGAYRVRFSSKYKGQTFEGPCCWAHQIEQAGRKP